MTSQQYLIHNFTAGPIFAVLVRHYTVANYSYDKLAMARLHAKMREQYPRADVDLVQLVPIDVTTLDCRKPVESMTLYEMQEELKKLRAAGAQ
jgi:hypothetical protein